MLTLLLDTAYSGLNIGILKDESLIEKIEIEANRKQSELTLPYLKELFDKHQLDPLKVSRIVITEGPGSFTGLRIAMTIAKVMASMIPCELYTINTLFTYIHPNVKKGLAIMDARSERAYIAKMHDGKLIGETMVLPLDKIESEGYQIFGDAQLIHQTSQEFSIIENMLAHQVHWRKIEDVDALVPLYLKEKDEYGSSN